MRHFVWFNPVTLQLYDREALYVAAKLQGFQPVECTQDHIFAVKEKYRQAVQQAKGACVVDMRCPEAARKVWEKWTDENFLFPDIHPILIHCAIELQQRLRPGEELFVTTPCTVLAEYGNKLHMSGTQFLSWNQFAERYSVTLPRRKLSASPIPPGFFSGFGEGVQALGSWAEIEAFFLQNTKERPRLLELLYCENGCHNGDGILEEEMQ